MKILVLLPAALLLMAAAPQRQLTLAVPGDSAFDLGVQSAPFGARPSRFEPAPLPNRDVRSPAAAAASTEPSLAPTLFTSKNQYRGDGFSPNSTAQSEQEKHVKPGAGFSLHMPLTPQ